MTEEERFEICYECTGLGDDWYIDDEGELINACNECPFNGIDNDD